MVSKQFQLLIFVKIKCRYRNINQIRYFTIILLVETYMGNSKYYIYSLIFNCTFIQDFDVTNVILMQKFIKRNKNCVKKTLVA